MDARFRSRIRRRFRPALKNLILVKSVSSQLIRESNVTSVLERFSANLSRTGKFEMRSRIRTGFLAAGAAAMLSSQAVYAAPVAASAASIDPLVSLSALAGAASRAAVCAGSTATAAAASAAAQAPAPGCVLPVNAAPPPPMAAPPPPPVVEAGPGIGMWPLLLGLAAVAGIAALLLLSDDDDDGDTTPISPG